MYLCDCLFSFSFPKSNRVEEFIINNKKKYMKYFSLLFACTLFLTYGYSQTKLVEPDLATLFNNPSKESRPMCYWFWMGGNFSKYGITKDLEAMKAAGLGGANIFNITSNVRWTDAHPENLLWPEQTYRSPAYWEAVRFAAAEAERLGMELGIHNSPGYSTTGGPWIKEEQGMQKLTWTNVQVDGGKLITVEVPCPLRPAEPGADMTTRRATYYKDIALLAVPVADSFGLKEVLNITAFSDGKGKVNWNAPVGKWKIYRIGNCPTMEMPHPMPEELMGKALEVNKMDTANSRYHWNSAIDPIKEHLGKYIGKSLKYIAIDSWESGDQNWSANFREDFIKLKGYDPVPWLVSFCKPITNARDNKQRKIINSDIETKRFEWDYRDAINRLFFENGWKVGKQISNDNNLKLQWEPYPGPFDIVEGSALADLPMGEFWTGGSGGIDGSIPAAGRAAGRTIVGSEAFTGRHYNAKYFEDPEFLKPSALGTFASGVNKLMLHHWVLQPFDDRYQPGLQMSWWGTHFSRFQTWAEPGKAFFSFLARSQALLQYGEQVVDYICVDKQDGFSDLIATHDFLVKDIKVENQQIILPSGRKYAFIVFPKGDTILPAVAEKIKMLIAAGAHVVAPQPKASPSLQDYPNADLKIKAIGEEVWGNQKENNYGKGWVTHSVWKAIQKCKLAPDFSVEKADSAKYIRFVHRQKGNTNIYYVANISTMAQKLTLSFRVKGFYPEIWQAEDGTIENASVWREEGGRTFVQLNLKGVQSAFVVFRKPTINTVHATNIEINSSASDCELRLNNNKPSLIAYKELTAKVGLSDGKEQTIEIKPTSPKELYGNWHVSFTPKMNKPFELDFSSLKDFSKDDNKDLKYFAGTAHYTKKIQISAAELASGKRIMLDLGAVYDIVQLTVNKKDMGVLWFPPYKKDITDVLKVGENTLDIAVTNNWANRLIGDQQEPEDFTYGKERVILGDTAGKSLKEYPLWFLKNTPRPSQGRKTFNTWFFYKKEALLQPAGLVGPVRLQYGEVVEL